MTKEELASHEMAFRGVEQPLSFEERYASNFVAERDVINDDGSKTTFRAYHGSFVPGTKSSEARMANFVVDMLQAGYTEAAGRIISYAGEDPDSNRQLASVLFFVQRSTPHER